MPVDTEKWIATQIGARWVRTEMPPMIAWTTTPEQQPGQPGQDSALGALPHGRDDRRADRGHGVGEHPVGELDDEW